MAGEDNPNNSFHVGYACNKPSWEYPTGSPAWQGKWFAEQQAAKQQEERQRAAASAQPAQSSAPSPSGESLLSGIPQKGYKHKTVWTYNPTAELRPSLESKKSDISESAQELWSLGLAGVLAVAYCHPDETAIVAGGVLAAAVICKVSADFNWSKPKEYLAQGASLAVAATGVYLVATNKLPEGAVISELWKNCSAILMGTGAAIGAYIYTRDKKFGQLGWKTALKGAAAAALVVGGVYFSGALNNVRHVSAPAIPRTAALSSDIVSAFVAAKQLNVRSKPTPGADKVETLDCAAEVHTFKGIAKGWTAIVLPDNSQAYVASRFLSYTRPTAQQCQM